MGTSVKDDTSSFAPHSGQKSASEGLSCWHRGASHAPSPRAGRGSGSGDDSAEAGDGSNHGAGLRAPYLPISVVSLSAFSSQYVMPISRYIAVAVARCCWACSPLSVRR
jgi:hypothetical protein